MEAPDSKVAVGSALGLLHFIERESLIITRLITSNFV